MAIPFLGKHVLCRRKKQTIIVLVVVVLVFCFMQFLSLMRLNVFRENQGEGLHPRIIVKVDEEKEENLATTKKTDIVYDKWRHIKLPRGVYSDDAHFYTPNKENTFSCVHTRTVISFDQVNDDFCDCDDGTDEPGTSACPQSRFYCQYQIPHEDAQFVPGSRVNDGICDCCDGSDEWSGHRVPENMRLSEENAYKSPKEDVYSIDLKPLQRYGPDGAFYKLSTQCYQHNTKEYEFTICPFSSIKQQKIPQPSISLGRNPSWEKQKPGDHVLLMLDGDTKLCPLGHARKTKIHFFCGIEDKVTQVTEYERCFYSVVFSSPAACS